LGAEYGGRTGVAYPFQTNFEEWTKSGSVSSHNLKFKVGPGAMVFRLNNNYRRLVNPSVVCARATQTSRRRIWCTQREQDAELEIMMQENWIETSNSSVFSLHLLKDVFIMEEEKIEIRKR
jgi:hypothetical protein